MRGKLRHIGGTAAVAITRKELRWEAFDDALEMRRHLFGASLMGVGGVLAGQRLSAASTAIAVDPAVSDRRFHTPSSDQTT